MSNVGGVNGGSSVLGSGYVGMSGGSMTGFSPDALLEYAATQLNNLGGQIDTLMAQQEQQINQSQAVQSVQTVLSQYAPNGPTNQTEYDQCVQAYQTAINNLPAGDPVAASLTTQLQSMESTCGQPGQTLTPDQAAQLASAQATVAQGAPPVSIPGTGEINPLVGLYMTAKEEVSSLTSIQNGTFSAPSTAQWAGVSSGLSNLNSSITSNTQLQMLNLQTVVSQEQQATEEATNMMTTENQTLLDQAKAV